MRAVATNLPPGIMEWRRRVGADRHDEVWEGVLHMNPVPNRDHHELAMDLLIWLRQFWARPGRNKVYPERNVSAPGGWPNNYRVPDLVLLTTDRLERDRNEFIEGGPSVVIEIHSPDDEVYILEEGVYRKEPWAKGGWIASHATGIELRGTRGEKLEIRMADDRATCRSLPEQ